MPTNPKVTNSPAAAPEQKKVVRKVIKKVIRKVPAQPVDDRPEEVKQAIKRAASTVDSRDHDIKSDYLDKTVPLEKANLRLYLISIGLMVVLILTTLGLLYAKARVEQNQDKLTAEALEESEEIEETPEPIVVQEIEVEEPLEVNVLEPEDITLEILNGSGVAGAAGDAQAEFEDLGYQVESIGNSDEIEKSELYIGSEFSEEELENLLDDVERRLGIEEVSGSLSDLDTTARIILGAE